MAGVATERTRDDLVKLSAGRKQMKQPVRRRAAVECGIQLDACRPVNNRRVLRQTLVMLQNEKFFLKKSFVRYGGNACWIHTITMKYKYKLDTRTHPFNGPLSGTTQVSRYQKGKTNLDFTGARDSEWQWHQLGHMQIYTSLQTNNHASTPPLSFFTGQMPFLQSNST